MHGRTIFAATFVALAQLAVASPPGCLLGAVNEYSDPSDVKSVCKAKDLDSKVKEFCGQDTKAAMKALEEICGDAGVDSDKVSSSGSASATGSASHSKTASATAYSAVETTISATSFVCSEATTITYGHSTYVVSSSTILEIPEYTTKIDMPEAPKATGTGSAGSHGSHGSGGSAGASGSVGTLVAMYPTGSNGHGGNGTAPHATGGPKPGNGANGPNGYAANGPNGANSPIAPSGTAGQYVPESTGAAGKLEFGMAAVVAGFMAAAL
jgi:hypothetical protein